MKAVFTVVIMCSIIANFSTGCARRNWMRSDWKEYSHEQKQIERVFYLKRPIKHQFPKMTIVNGQSYFMNPKSNGILIGGFYASQTEITNEQFCFFLNAVKDTCRLFSNADTLKRLFGIGSPNRVITLNEHGQYVVDRPLSQQPVTHVNYAGAMLYCNWLSAYYRGYFKSFKYLMLGQFRLPSYIEWQWMALDTFHIKDIPYSHLKTKNSLQKAAWYANNSGNSPQNVGRLKPKNHMYDLIGNVWEWTSDSTYGVFEQPWNYESKAKNIVGHSYLSGPELILKDSLYFNHRDSSRSDLGFRIVQTYLGRSSGAEF